MNNLLASNSMLAGTLAILLQHCLSTCPISGLQAAELLARLADDPTLDEGLRDYCDQFSRRLYQHSRELRT